MSWTHNLNMVRWVKKHFSVPWLFRDVAVTSIITQSSSIKHQVISQDGFGHVEILLRDAPGRKTTCCVNREVLLWSTKGAVEGQGFQASGGSQILKVCLNSIIQELLPTTHLEKTWSFCSPWFSLQGRSCCPIWGCPIFSPACNSAAQNKEVHLSLLHC